MKSNSSLKGERAPEGDSALPLQIVVIADHPNAAAGARNLVNEFVLKWAPDIEVHRDDWSFTELENLEFRRESLELSRCCDMLIISLGGNVDLPDSFSDWLKDWRQSRAANHATFVLCASAVAPSALPTFASLPVDLCDEGLSCFLTSISLRHGCLPPPVRPKALLDRIGSIDRMNLPEVSLLND